MNANAQVYRLSPQDLSRAADLVRLLAQVFGEDQELIGKAWLENLLRDPKVWLVAADHEGHIVGGLTAHELPMTRSETRELFIYDVAVDLKWQRKGIGRTLIEFVRREARSAGLSSVFVLASNEDEHAISFYKSAGLEPEEVTLFAGDPDPSED